MVLPATAEFWEKPYESGSYLDHWDYRFPSQELVTFVASGLLPENARCLDVGCGAGREAVFLAQCGFCVTAIDLSSRAIEIATERGVQEGVRINWLQCSAFDTQLPDEHFDFINDRGCFHLIHKDERDAYVTEMARLLKPGGRMLIRGCRESSNPNFVVLDHDSVNLHFPRKLFKRGPILPITLISDKGSLNANVVVLVRE